MAFFVGVEFGNLAFDLGRYDQYFSSFVFYGFADSIHIFITVPQTEQRFKAYLTS